jgi:hypothetical protein
MTPYRKGFMKEAQTSITGKDSWLWDAVSGITGGAASPIVGAVRGGEGSRFKGSLMGLGGGAGGAYLGGVPPTLVAMLIQRKYPVAAKLISKSQFVTTPALAGLGTRAMTIENGKSRSTIQEQVQKALNRGYTR